MCIQILGSSPLAEPIARLAERAGLIVQWSGSSAVAADSDEPLQLVILVSAGSTIEADLARAPSQNLVVVDATTPSHTDYPSGVRIVRAFASVPAEAFADLSNHPSSDGTPNLAVPLAGDDSEAKAIVAAFMRQIGLEPFDLGAMGAAEVLDPGGALWGKALSQVELLEAVGWLAGDG